MYKLFRMMHDNILREQEEMRMSKKISPDFLMNKNHEELSMSHTLFQVSNHVEQFNCILREVYILYFKLILLMRYALLKFFCSSLPFLLS